MDYMALADRLQGDAKKNAGLPDEYDRDMDLAGADTAARMAIEPYDWFRTAQEVYDDPRDPWNYAGFLPFVAGGTYKAVKGAKNAIEGAKDVAKVVDDMAPVKAAFESVKGVREVPNYGGSEKQFYKAVALGASKADLNNCKSVKEASTLITKLEATKGSVNTSGKAREISKKQINALRRGGYTSDEISKMTAKDADLAVGELFDDAKAVNPNMPDWDGTGTDLDTRFQEAYDQWMNKKIDDVTFEKMTGKSPEITPPTPRGPVASPIPGNRAEVVEKVAVPQPVQKPLIPEVVEAVNDVPQSAPLNNQKVSGKKAFGPVTSQYIRQVDAVVQEFPELGARATEYAKAGMNPKALADRLMKEADAIKARTTVYDAKHWADEGVNPHLPELFEQPLENARHVVDPEVMPVLKRPGGGFTDFSMRHPELAVDAESALEAPARLALPAAAEVPKGSRAAKALAASVALGAVGYGVGNRLDESYPIPDDVQPDDGRIPVDAAQMQRDDGKTEKVMLTPDEFDLRWGTIWPNYEAGRKAGKSVYRTPSWGER
jgi:hypothetical protein